MQAGWLLTAANVGDSSAVLDLGFRTLPLTSDHRVASSKTEQDRLKRLGLNVTNVDRSGESSLSCARRRCPVSLYMLLPSRAVHEKVISSLCNT